MTTKSRFFWAVSRKINGLTPFYLRETPWQPQAGLLAVSPGSRARPGERRAARANSPARFANVRVERRHEQ
jgi:hypothetical protein